MSENNEIQKYKLPSISELYSGDLETYRDQTALVALLNAPPSPTWIKKHPLIKVERLNEAGQKEMVPLEYINIETIEYLLTRIFTRWHVEIKSCLVIANSVVVSIRLYYMDITNPDTMLWQDGIGACDIQTKKDAKAMDISSVNHGAVQKAVPAAESYAIKDAAHKIGKIFGKDLGRKNETEYSFLIQKTESLDKQARILKAMSDE